MTKINKPLKEERWEDYSFWFDNELGCVVRSKEIDKTNKRGIPVKEFISTILQDQKKKYLHIGEGMKITTKQIRDLYKHNQGEVAYIAIKRNETIEDYMKGIEDEK